MYIPEGIYNTNYIYLLTFNVSAAGLYEENKTQIYLTTLSLSVHHC